MSQKNNPFHDVTEIELVDHVTHYELIVRGHNRYIKDITKLNPNKGFEVFEQIIEKWQETWEKDDEPNKT